MPTVIPFQGELDDTRQFVPFVGGLDAPPAPTSLPQALSAASAARAGAGGPLSQEAATNLGAGIVQGAVRDPGLSLARGAQWAGQNIPAVGQVAGNMPDDWVDSLTAARNAYDQKYGKSSAAAVGRTVGQMAPATLAGMGAGAVASRLPIVGNLLSGAAEGGPITRLLSLGGQGSVQGAAGAAATSGQSDVPFGQQLKTGALAGGFLNPIVGAAAGIKNALTVDPDTAALAQAAVSHGMPLRASQISNSPALRYFDAMLRITPFSGYGQNSAELQTAFNRAAALTMGESADRLSPTVFQNARTRIGGVFDDVANNTTINPTAATDLVNTLANIETRASRLTGQEYGAVRSHVDDVMDALSNNGGTIPGDVYLSLTKKGSPLFDAMDNDNSNISQRAHDIKDALDQALQSSATPEQAAALGAARSQWKNMKTLAPLLGRADTIGGALPSMGDISPAALRARVNQVFGPEAAAMGYDGDLGQLAQIGQRFLKEPPSSGTAERSMFSPINLLAEAGGVGAGIAAGHFGPAIAPEIAVPAGIVAGAALPAVWGASAAMRSPGLRNSLISRGLGSFSYDPARYTTNVYQPNAPGVLDLAYRYGAPLAGALANRPGSSTP